MINSSGNASFATTGMLGAYQGLTIVTTWPKGHVREPDLSENIGYILEDNFSLLLGLVGLLIIFLYYYWVWNKVGRDPETGVIFPHYYPPEGFTPASMRFISRMGYDDKTFATAIVNLAVKGALEISESNGRYNLIQHTISREKLAAGEFVLLKELFSDGSTITLKQSNHKIIAKSIEAHQKSLKLDYQKLYFKTNYVWSLPGFITSIVLIVAIFLSAKSSTGQQMTPLLIWLIVWTSAVVGMMYFAVKLWMKAVSGKGYRAAISMTIFASIFFAAEIFVIYTFNVPIPLFITIAAIIFLNTLFYNLLKAPTRAGRKLLDKIDGFKMYLDVAEKDELNLKNPPEKTPEIFEIYLPSAMALDVEQRWAEKFSSVFERLERQGKEYQPGWYHGQRWNSNNLGGFSSAVGSSLSSAISSSSTAPGSSSGSGGGGSSGGGGGGGGGGGW
jgi:uncharacterized membrane protein YgcG